MRHPICEVCRDTHTMQLPSSEVMCTHCPVPCQTCRRGGTGAFCETTPCACECHQNDWRYQKARTHFGPPQIVVDKAIEAANTSPCAKSKRGVVMFTLRMNGALDIHAAKHNAPPWPYECDGSMDCKENCRRVAVHAEQNAIIAGLRHTEHRLTIHETDYPWRDLSEDSGLLQMLHVKTVDGQLVGSPGGPSCDECSKLVLAAGVEVFWLYNGQHWDRYDGLGFHKATLKKNKLYCYL